MLSGIIIIAVIWLASIGTLGYFWTRYDVFIQDKTLTGKPNYTKSDLERQFIYHIYVVSAVLAIPLFFGLLGIIPAFLVIIASVGIVYYTLYLLMMEDGVKDSVISDLSSPTNLWVQDANTEDGSVKRWTIYSALIAYPLFLFVIAITGLVIHPLLPVMMIF